MVNYTEEGKNTEFDMTAQKANRGTVIGMIRKMKAISRYVVDKMVEIHKSLGERLQGKLFVLCPHIKLDFKNRVGA